MEPGAFVLIGYACQTQNPSKVEMKIVDECEFELVPPSPRPGLADHPHHMLVKTSSPEIVDCHVGKLISHHPILDKFITLLSSHGWSFWLLHRYVSERLYLLP